jgi:2-amino-4-hydroxy-6-hydroxymethyldihydropteridine diphosphokinase
MSQVIMQTNIRQVVLGLGSNRGGPRAILAGAAQRLGGILSVLRVAPLFETEPVGVTDQSRFLNTAVCGFCLLSPQELLAAIHRIEADFGRDRARERRWGERTLDIDILTFGDEVVSEPPTLEIPHPRLRERAFALAPLLELLPDAADPLTGEPYRDILARLPDQGVKKFEKEA